MLNYNEYDFCPYLDKIEAVAKVVGIEPPTEDDVWADARRFTNVPILENVYQRILFSNLKVRLESAGFKADYKVNCRDSWFTLNNEELNRVKVFKKAIVELLKPLKHIR